MTGPSENKNLSEIDVKQRHPFIVFYASVAAFSLVLVLAAHLHSVWHGTIRTLSYAIGAFSVWSFYRLFSLTDERQRQTNERALRFGFVATLVLSLVGGFIRGFGTPIVSCGGLLSLMLTAWSVGLILFSWRYR